MTDVVETAENTESRPTVKRRRPGRVKVPYNVRPKLLMNVEQTAEALGVTEHWLRKQAQDGKVPCIDVEDGQFLFHAGSVEKVLAAQLAQKAERALALLDERAGG
ncbi:MAG: hypothetical protein V3V71_09100 [Roseateles sp.]